jgi:hypothetical protein
LPWIGKWMHGWWYGIGWLFVQCKWQKETFVELVHLKGIELGWYRLKCSILDICKVGLAFIPLKFIFGMWLKKIYFKMLACISYPLIFVLIALLWPQEITKKFKVLLWSFSFNIIKMCHGQIHCLFVVRVKMKFLFFMLTIVGRCLIE